MAQAFDTLAAAKTLHDAGMNREHAEAVASIVRQGQGELVTEATLDARLAALEARLTNRLYAVAGAIVGAVFASAVAVAVAILQALPGP